MKAFLVALVLGVIGLGLAVYLLSDRGPETVKAPPVPALAQPPAAAPAPAPVAASAAEEDEEDFEAYMREVTSERALADNCQVCHSDSMYTSQRLTPKQWKAEVDKMVSWGAASALDEEERASVVDYLARHYGPDTPVAPPRRTTLADVKTFEVPGDPHAGTAGADLARGAELYKATCATCHGPTALGEPELAGVPLGPALVDQAMLTHAKAFYELIDVGRRSMPAMNAALNAEQERDILAWLRSLPHGPSSSPAAAP